MKDSSLLNSLELQRSEFPRTWEVLDAGISQGVAPGFVFGFWTRKNSDQIWAGACGNRRMIPSPQTMHVDTIFDLASLTKVFATTPLVAVLVDRGWLSWDTPLAAFFPDYPYRNIEIRHLLSHTAGFVAWEPFWEKMRESVAPDSIHRLSVQTRQRMMRDLVLSAPPEANPGEQAVYSDLSFLLLGFALEQVVQMPLDRAVERFVWQPMGVRGAFYKRITTLPEQAIMPLVAATENSSWRGGVLQGQVHDDNCWAMGGYAGHAGAFGNIRDLLHFARTLVSFNFLSRAALEKIWTPVSQPPGCARTLGWDTPSGEQSSVGTRFSPQTVGHLGFTGVSLWIDLEAGLAVALLSNRVHPSRDNIQIRAFRPQLHEAIRMDLGF